MNELNYVQYCPHRLPCGICEKTNQMCPLMYQGPTITYTTNTCNVNDVKKVDK